MRAAKRLHSWRVLILPFMGEEALYGAYNFKEPWNGPNNSQLAGRMPSVYRCPSNSAAQTTTKYVSVVGPETVLKANRSSMPLEIVNADGPKNTLLVVEGMQAVNWMEPSDLDYMQMSFKIGDATGIGSNHPSGPNALFADGHISPLPTTTDPQALKSLVLPADGLPGFPLEDP